MSETATLTLTDFLLQRFAEEEAAAHAMPASVEVTGLPAEVMDHLVRWRPARVLAECEAKRRIVEEHDELHWPTGSTGMCRTCAENEDADYDGAPLVPLPCPTLRALALPHADHPDFREEWRV